MCIFWDYLFVAYLITTLFKQVLAVSRVMVAWQPIGISMGIYDMCHRYGNSFHLHLLCKFLSLRHVLNSKWNRYLKERKQFGAPLAAFQINQQKLVHMLANVQAMVLLGWRLCKLYENGKMTPGHASLAKVRHTFSGDEEACFSYYFTLTILSNSQSWISLKARETAALGRELLGGNGVLADFLVAKVSRRGFFLKVLYMIHLYKLNLN